MLVFLHVRQSDRQRDVARRERQNLIRRLRFCLYPVATGNVTRHDYRQRHRPIGTATLDEIRIKMLRQRPIELFIDASTAVGAAVSVSREWTQFFSLNREHLKRVSVLAGSKVVHLTVSIAQHLSQTGNLIQIYSDAELFNARVASAPSGV